jgi:pimeloyl-ACP methyl ester carboxylesterase
MTAAPSLLKPTPVQPEKPLFLFLPGMDGTGRLLHRQVEGLRPYFDLRCLSLPPQARTDWQTLTNQVLALIQQEMVQVPRTLYLCGESFGACLALQLALRATEWIDRLILLNPASAFRSYPLLHWASYLTDWLPEALQAIASDVLLPFLIATERVEWGDRQKLLAAMKTVPARTSAWRLSLLRTFDVSVNDLKHLSHPTLLIASGSDRLLPSVAESNRLAAALPNSQQIILPHSGHACLLEADVNLAALLSYHHFVPCSTDARSYAPHC